MDSFLIQRATHKQAVFAGSTAFAIVLALAAAAPQAAHPLPAVSPFMPMCALTVFTTAGIAAFLLGAQFIVTRQPMLGALGGAYAFTALAVALQLLMFPGVFTPTGLFGAHPASAGWMWVFWHGGFPFFVTLALLVRDRFKPEAVDATRIARWTWLLVGGPMAVGLLLCGLVLAVDLPPALGRTDGGAGHATALILWALNVVALLLVLARGRLHSVLDLWLAIAALACFTDTSLNLLSPDRFTVGWYVARIFSMLAPGVLVCLLVWEVTTLYRRLFEANVSLQQASTHDALTGIYNRSYFNEQFPRAFDEARRKAQPFSLLMIDVDHFKRYNDTFGHLKGDGCLVTIAAALEGVLRRRAGFIARYGGEEFAVVLPDATPRDALLLAESAREAVLHLRIEAPTPSRYVTISAGCATAMPEASTSLEALIEAADATLYRAKAAGRNLVVPAETLRPARLA
ncbi:MULTISPECIES: sensor domain-containing diguanylate cyclase [Ralstonia solanacearum species complex]|uniref:diguanylate cyclase n=3 Tax=Ralstonia solanacearum TaxID=305 RepID=A0ABF7RGK0_RALSL|nr:sensor domain-containing diguanylate cyclase [Ralstonia solanacearum]ALF86712.1 Phytochrome-like protein cph2 [Ralstonia solanacearum]ATI26281.1 GGDEF domain-containing protein [Ralstonia solanacearum]EAP74036.1 Transcriptional regulatory protein [Ralstonia solanacearum UW551]KEI33329.1 DeoR faimly transcriptional regulator [Ralstonia solanacearum]KFX79099.1 DeoR faimly transcriptional regulator [Ralstonia solanacearum]